MREYVGNGFREYVGALNRVRQDRKRRRGMYPTEDTESPAILIIYVPRRGAYR